MYDALFAQEQDYAPHVDNRWNPSHWLMSELFYCQLFFFTRLRTMILLGCFWEIKTISEYFGTPWLRYLAVARSAFQTFQFDVSSVRCSWIPWSFAVEMKLATLLASAAQHGSERLCTVQSGEPCCFRTWFPWMSSVLTPGRSQRGWGRRYSSVNLAVRLKCKADVETLSHAMSNAVKPAKPNLMAFQEYAFYGVSVQRLLQREIGRDVSKAAAELLAGNPGQQRLDLYGTENVTSTAKNKNPWSWMTTSESAYLLLFRWIEVSSEWELSVPSVDGASAAPRRVCFNHQGNSGSQLFSPAGMMCEMCGFLCLWLLFPFSPLCNSSTPLLFQT